MRELFLSLHALLPHSNTIIKYIPLAVARLRVLQSRRDASSGQSPSAATKAGAAAEIVSSSSTVTDAGSGNSEDCSIRVAPEPSSSVSIRVRGDQGRI
ncbi:hypothetical protein Syun_011741 [Stephania yunnanensis]|uniref:Uncharacterized protein n=1 Tax=Stephania yunnanensis TaxID=152371 RepID=A0AAP0JY50_9MAGN